MELPDNSIGVTDILQWRDCGRRFEFGMRRHSEGASPQADGPSNAYGSAFHDAVAYIRQNDATDADAVRFIMQGPYARWIAPEDLERFHKDLATYRARDYYNVKTIAVERELRIPLVKYKGTQYYYRFKIDRLYQTHRDPGTWLHIDYKTSAHPKSEAEVHSDIQLSAYALGIREIFPEIRTLVQLLDQLNFGVVPTSRTPEQLEMTREWLIENAIAIIEDEDLEPTYNQFCAYCPILMDCPIVPKLTDYALAEIAGMVPEGANKGPLADRDLEAYVGQLDQVAEARKILDKFDDRLKETMRGLPIERRLALGFKTSRPNVSSWSPSALEAIEEILGPEFYRMVRLPKKALERLSEPVREVINGMADEHQGAPRLTRVKPPKESAFGEGEGGPSDEV